MATFSEKYGDVVKEENFLGGGATGSVYKTGDGRAIKVYKQGYVSYPKNKEYMVWQRHNMVSYVMELVTLRNIANEHIGQILEAGVIQGATEKLEGDFSHFFKVGQVMPSYKFDLASIIYRPSNGLDYNTIKFFSAQLLDAVAYLSSVGLIHRDIKPANIMITEGNVLKLVDFGEVCASERVVPMNDRGSVPYKAPEALLLSQVYDERVDVWAAGCVIIEMFKGQTAFYPPTVNGIYEILKKFTPPEKRMISFSDEDDPGSDYEINRSNFDDAPDGYKPGATPLNVLISEKRRTEIEKEGGKGDYGKLETMISSMFVFDFDERVTVFQAIRDSGWLEDYGTIPVYDKRTERLSEHFTNINKKFDRVGVGAKDAIHTIVKKVLEVYSNDQFLPKQDDDDEIVERPTELESDDDVDSAGFNSVADKGSVRGNDYGDDSEEDEEGEPASGVWGVVGGAAKWLTGTNADLGEEFDFDD